MPGGDDAALEGSALLLLDVGQATRSRRAGRSDRLDGHQGSILLNSFGPKTFWINFHQPPLSSHPKAFIYMIIMDITKSWSQSYDF
jgi:hypothetical protein